MKPNLLIFALLAGYGYLILDYAPHSLDEWARPSKGPWYRPALARRDVDIQLFSLLMNASLSITAS